MTGQSVRYRVNYLRQKRQKVFRLLLPGDLQDAVHGCTVCLNTVQECKSAHWQCDQRARVPLGPQQTEVEVCFAFLCCVLRTWLTSERVKQSNMCLNQRCRDNYNCLTSDINLSVPDHFYPRP